MKNKIQYYELTIAGIQFVITAPKGRTLHLSARHQGFKYRKFTQEHPWDMAIRCYYWDYIPEMDQSPVRIWEANDGQYRWKVFDYDLESVIYIYYPELSAPVILMIDTRRMDKPVLIYHPEKECEALPYPVDFILLQFYALYLDLLTVHACGFILDQKVYVCPGQSGSGKSTISRLAAEAGGEVIQDDRLFIRKVDEKWYAFPAPLSEDDQHSKHEITCICALFHGKTNIVHPVISEQDKSSFFLPHMIHFPKWKGNYLYQLMLAEQLLNEIPLYRLHFLPDSSAMDYLRQNNFEN